MKKLFNKVLLVKFLFLVSVCTFSQKRNEQDSIKVHSLIELKKSELKKNDISEIICIYDEIGRLFIICKSNHKIKYSTFNSKKTKWSRIKCLTKNELLVNNIIEKPSLINLLNNKDCDENAHAFIRINIIVEKDDAVFRNYFFTNCNQVNEIKELVKLYYFLIGNVTAPA